MKHFFTGFAAVSLTTPALAHNPLNSTPIENFFHGFLPSVGHPFLSFEHLPFLVLVGIAAVLAGWYYLTPIVKRVLITFLAISIIATPALAHHPLNGAPMETFFHGLLSGIGHPVLGFDHLFFVALVGIAAIFTKWRLATPLAYLGAMALGTLVVIFGANIPMAEIGIVFSLITLGGIMLKGQALKPISAVLIFAGFGLFHGAAFGTSVAGYEGGLGAQILIGYMIGLILVQYAVALGAGYIIQKRAQILDATAPAPRLAGAAVAGVGLYLGLEIAETAILTSLF